VIPILGAGQFVRVIATVIVGDYFRALAALAGIVVCYWFGMDASCRAHKRIVSSEGATSR
jgi:hypothetical protein